MKRSERFVCPPPGEDKRRYLWWARRVLEECDAAAARLSGGTAQPVLVGLPNVPSHGVAYLVNEFHSSDRFSLLSCSRGIMGYNYTMRLITPVHGEVFEAAGYTFGFSFQDSSDEISYVYGGKDD